MRNKILVIFLLLAALSVAQASVTKSEFQNETTGTSPVALEIANSWQTLAVLAIVISAIIAAIGYMAGIGFEIPELRAWAGSELVQVIVNVLIVLVLVGALAFVDVIVIAIVRDAQLPLACAPGESCLQKVTTYYLNDYVVAANTTARDVLTNNIEAAAAANRRGGITCLTIYCLQFGFSTTFAAQKVLDQDYYAIIFEYVTNLLSFMEAQKFFVADICFKMAPVVLAMGVVARSFFFTRKIGGLLMAVAIGAIFFFPGMYIFDWITLDMALNGDKLMDTAGQACPAECALSPPLAYYYNSAGQLVTLSTTGEVTDAFNDSDTSRVDNLLQRTSEHETGSAGSANGRPVHSCYYGSYDGQNFYAQDSNGNKYAMYGNCSTACRELPYPGSTSLCAAVQTQASCALLPVECKVVRKVQDINQTLYAKCPESCRIVPPLKSDCRLNASKAQPTTAIGSCLSSRFDCRVADRNDLTATPPVLTRRPQPSSSTPDDPPAYQKTSCLQASQCLADLNASKSCVYVMPETGTCDDLCLDCPVYCRLIGTVDRTHPAPMGNVNLTNLPDSCKNAAGTALSDACTTCIRKYDSCTVNLSAITGLGPTAPNCTACPVEDRLLYPNLPSQYTSNGCTMGACPKEYRATMPHSTCENCLFTDEAYTYNPPVNTECSEICAPSDSAPVGKAGDFMNVGSTGLVGKPEIQDVAKLMLPVYVLPLFNIVATLVFIKALSGFLGGDIEIPGLSKVF